MFNKKVEILTRLFLFVNKATIKENVAPFIRYLIRKI